jgi:putative SbcD/Mre11-related phosphoesterase
LRQQNPVLSEIAQSGEKMRITEGIEIVENYPAVFIEPLDTLVVADLHLGFERELAESGIFLPHFQYQDIKESVASIVSRVSPRQVIINGDLKHKFGERTTQELNEVIDLLDYLTQNSEKVVVVRGNHDNFVKGLFARYPKVEFVETYYSEGSFIFTHGHEIWGGIESERSGVLVIAHEHPAIALRDDVGVKVKLRALLAGKTDTNKDLIVLPAFSPISLGGEVNLVTDNEQILSPFLKTRGTLMRMRAYAIDARSGIFSFPELRYWSGTEPRRKVSR